MVEQQSSFCEQFAEAFSLQVAVRGKGGVFNPSTVSCQVVVWGVADRENSLLYLGNIVNRLTMSYEEKLHRNMDVWCGIGGRRSLPRWTSSSRELQENCRAG